MKRFFALLVVLLVAVPCIPCALADDGVYVPSYRSFMESFTGQIKNINNDLYQAIVEDCFVDGQWIEPTNSSYNKVSCYTVPVDLRIYEGNGFPKDIYITIPREKLETDEELFKDIILAVGTSVITNADDKFKETFFDNLYYDYALNSPAGYISMYWNCGVYLFNTTKSSREIQCVISLSVYEAE